jgi:predicted nucleic acid-binding protein
MLRIESASAPRRTAKLPRRFAALAASVVLSIVVVHEWQLARREKGLEARRQLIEALRMTGEKLDLAYQIVNGEPQREKPSS